MPKFSQLLNKTTTYISENAFLFYSILVLIISFFTYFFGYQNPQAPFWDENFHIAASQKYLDNVFFVELHPPLGKLLIAAGEGIWNPNDPNSEAVKNNIKNEIVIETNTPYTDTPEQQELFRSKQTKFADTIANFNSSDYIKEFPKNYSFIGVRFFPALLSFLAGYLFFVLLYIFSKNAHLAFIFSSLYLFNNPLITHFRGAMLDGIQMFFILATLVYFAYLFVDKRGIKYWQYMILGLLVGLSVSTKINSLILILLFPFLFIVDNFDNFKDIFKSYQQILLDGFKGGINFVLGIAIVFGIVQYLHLNLAKNILPEKGAYNGFSLNEGYRKIVDQRSFENPLSVFSSTIGWWEYQTNYNKGVPKLDTTKPDENGSYPTNWIVGRKTISYRWDRFPVERQYHNTYKLDEEPGPTTLDQAANVAPEEKDKWVVVVKYLYLVANPAIWLISILGIIFGIALLLSWMVFGLKIKNYRLLSLIGFFVIMYSSYMISVLTVERVLYLYHYFVALMFALITAYLVFLYRFEDLLTQPKKSKYLYFTLAFIYILVFATFIFYAPFSYYLPLTTQEFQMRNWFSFWGMKSV